MRSGQSLIAAWAVLTLSDPLRCGLFCGRTCTSVAANHQTVGAGAAGAQLRQGHPVITPDPVFLPSEITHRQMSDT